MVGVEDVEEGCGCGFVNGGGDLEEEFFAADSICGDATNRVAVRDSGRAKIEAALEAVLAGAAGDAGVAETNTVVPDGDISPFARVEGWVYLPF